MIPITHLLRQCNKGYQFGEMGRKINCLLYMDDLKLYGKELELLVHTVRVCGTDIGIQF